MGSWAPGAAQTPKLDDFRPAQKSCIKNPIVTKTLAIIGVSLNNNIFDVKKDWLVLWGGWLARSPVPQTGRKRAKTIGKRPKP